MNKRQKKKADKKEILCIAKGKGNYRKDRIVDRMLHEHDVVVARHIYNNEEIEELKELCELGIYTEEQVDQMIKRGRRNR